MKAILNSTKIPIVYIYALIILFSHTICIEESDRTIVEQNALNCIVMPESLESLENLENPENLENEKPVAADSAYPIAIEKFKNYSDFHIIEQQWSYGSDWVNAALKKDLKVFENVLDESKIRLVSVSKGWIGGKKGHKEILPPITHDLIGVFLC